MPTEKIPGVEAFFFDSGVSASQFWTAKTTASLHKEVNEIQMLG